MESEEYPIFGFEAQQTVYNVVLCRVITKSTIQIKVPAINKDEAKVLAQFEMGREWQVLFVY